MAGPKTCYAVGCKALLLPYGLFCPRCWAIVPSDLQRLIGRHHRPGKRPTKRLEQFITLAVREVLFFRTEGKYSPRATSFEWDEPQPPSPETQLALDEPGSD